MAESFASRIAENIISALSNITYQEISLAWGVDGDIEKLKKKLATMKAVGLAAGQKQAPDNSLGVWLQELKDACYDAEDVVDEFEIEALRKQLLKQRGIGKTVSYFFSSSNPLVFRFKMAHKIKQLNQSFHEIAALRNNFHVADKHDGPSHDLRRDRETTSFVLASEVIGRDEEKKRIVKMLTQDDPAEEDIPVLPIVGIGGLGKTALAKLVFNDAAVDSHFELRRWVCVSSDFDLKGLMVKIIKSRKGGDGDPGSRVLEQLQEALLECLNGKKYLLILDDVWNEDNKKWVELKNLLAGGASGSRIVVTTRSNRVADITGTLPCHHLKALPYEKSLSLFLKYAFKKGKEKQHPNLAKIGQAIVKKCQGIPLVVKALGSMLFSKTSEQEWKLVRDNERWELMEKDNETISILKLSYDQLSPQLKKCFAYCSLYPKDYCFIESDLIAFWMAHGLLESPNTNENPYDIGRQYLNELLSGSFFQDSDEGHIFDAFKMHDLFHDLALSVSKNECCVVSSFEQNTAPGVRHMWLMNSHQNPPKFLDKFGHLRSLRLPDSDKSLVETCLTRFQRLRMLDLSESTLQVLPKWIGYLKHLRFLDLSNCPNIKKLPNSLCELHKLQTLNFHGCGQIEEMPKKMRYMVSLKFLSLTTQQQDLGGHGLQHLKSLQLLVIYGCPNLKYLFQEIQELTSLNTLVIATCKNLVSLPLGLANLTALQSLIIADCKQLDLSRTQGFQEKEDNDDNGFSLQSLGIASLPKLGALPQWLLRRSANTLKNLTVADCVNLTTSAEWHNLTSLEKLTIIHCPRLSSLPNTMQHLKQLKIEYCHLLSQRCQQGTGVDWLKIAHASFIVLDGNAISANDN